MVDAQFASNPLLTQEVIKDMTTEKKLADCKSITQSSCADKPAKKSKISRSIEKRGHKKSCCNSHISDRRTHNRTTIKLTHRKGHRIVKIADFVDVSLLIKQQQVTGRLPQSVDLKDYNEQTVSIFADYIEKKDVKVKKYRSKKKKGSDEKILRNHAFQTETSIQYMAAWRFVELAHLTNFSNIPYHQNHEEISLNIVFSGCSCELNVAHELVVADAALLWLVGQPQPDIFAPGVFAMVSRFARMSMESRHNARTCLEEEHVRRHLARCGLVEIENRPKETNLSLSRPRYGIKWMDQESTKSSKCVKHSRSTFTTKTKTLPEVEQSKNESEIKSKANIKEKNLKDK
uniref:Cyclin_C domain-containing protein n=1 Tax=Heterorhabditis bacteriophora TaxID=37862 RepID=A0A1I7X6S1_HETBA